MHFRQSKQKFEHNEFEYLIIDTDGGGDDCQALIVLDYYIRSSGKKLLGITCSNGNTNIDDVVRNVLIVQQICGSHYPVYVGIDYNLAGENIKDYFFGKDGLGLKQEHYLEQLKLSKNIYDHSLVQREKPYKFIADSAIKYRNQISIINIGPLTNLALSYHYNNQISNCFSNIVCMGCSDSLAGLHSFYTAEFNAAIDPEATFCIFQKFINILLITLDAACFSIPEKQVQKLYINQSIAKADFIRNIYQYQYHKPTPVNPQVVDPLAVVCLFKPQAITEGLYVKVKIQYKGQRTRGCSIIDYFSPNSKEHNVYLANSFDVRIINQEIERAYFYNENQKQQLNEKLN